MNSVEVMLNVTNLIPLEMTFPIVDWKHVVGEGDIVVQFNNDIANLTRDMPLIFYHIFIFHK